MEYDYAYITATLPTWAEIEIEDDEQTWDDDLEAKYERADNRMRKLVLMARNARMRRGN